MKTQEAIKILKCSKQKFTVLESEINRNAAIDIAIKSLEKQVAKKPRIWANRSKHCPDCDEVVFYHDAYCIHCGQKLDWGDEE